MRLLVVVSGAHEIEAKRVVLDLLVANLETAALVACNALPHSPGASAKSGRLGGGRRNLLYTESAGIKVKNIAR